MDKINVRQSGLVAFIYLILFFLLVTVMHSTRTDHPVVKLKNEDAWVYVRARWEGDGKVWTEQLNAMNSTAVIDLRQTLYGYVNGRYKLEPHSDQTMAMRSQMSFGDEFLVFLTERPIVPASVNFTSNCSLVGVPWIWLLSIYTIAFLLLFFVLNKFLLKGKLGFENASFTAVFVMFSLFAGRQIVGYWISVEKLDQNRIVIQSSQTVDWMRAKEAVWRQGKWFLGDKHVSSEIYMEYELSEYPKADSLNDPDLKNLIHYRVGDIVVQPGPNYKSQN